MSATDDEQQRPRRQRRRGEPDLGVLTPPSIPRIDVPGIPSPRSRRRRSPATPAAPAPVQNVLPFAVPVPPVAPPVVLEATALELRDRAARTTRRLLLLAAFCLLAATSPQLPATGRWVLAAVVLVGAVRMAQVWRRAFRRRREERALGATTWPGAEDLARP